MLRHLGSVTPAPHGLIQVGPRVTVTFSPHPEDAKLYADRGEAPPLIKTSLLIDTGAECTLVDDEVLRQLKLAPVRFKPIMFGDGEPQHRPVYRVMIWIAMEDEARRSITGQFLGDVVGMAAQKQGHAGLMGRDFLRNFRFKYDGAAGTFELISDGDQDPELKAERARERHEKKKLRGRKK